MENGNSKQTVRGGVGRNRDRGNHRGTGSTNGASGKLTSPLFPLARKRCRSNELKYRCIRRLRLVLLMLWNMLQSMTSTAVLSLDRFPRRLGITFSNKQPRMLDPHPQFNPTGDKQFHAGQKRSSFAGEKQNHPACFLRGPAAAHGLKRFG